MLSAEEGTNWRQIIAAIGTFAAGFLIVAALLHLAIGNGLFLHADIRSEKLALMRQWQGRAYSASFGSSHVHNGFDPRAFDAALQGTPAQTRTLNLAIAGGSQTEQRVTALEFLKHLQPPPPGTGPQACIALLELKAGANFTNDHLVHPRAINIYDWPTARFVAQLTSPHMPFSQKAGRIGYAVAGMTMHYTNLGMLSSIIFAPPLDQEALTAETIDDRRGLLVLPDSPLILPSIRKELAEQKGPPAPTPDELLPGNRALVEELAAASPVKNLAFVYVVMPMIPDLTQYPVPPEAMAWSGGSVPILNLRRPDLYPELYHAELWLDGAHLNEQGAALASTLLARELKTWYAAHGAPAPCGG